jgi:hypothetical protein
LWHRTQCQAFTDAEPIERDTTYPGATYAPWDHHDDLLDDSSDIDFIADAPRNCINHLDVSVKENTKYNSWDKALALLFDRKVESKGVHTFPTTKEVLFLLSTSRIPTYGFRIGLPPQKSLGFDRGLWFYRSEKLNFDLAKNASIKSDMKKLMMVFLYHVWFKNVETQKVICVSKKREARFESDEEHIARTKRFKENLFLALDCADKYSIAKDLAWWMLNVFKDASALAVYPPEEEVEIEFVSLSILDKALMAAELAQSDCSTHEELDEESIAYDQMLNSMGYESQEDEIADKDGHPIY